MNRKHVTGLVLAGGRGLRMGGVDKGLIAFGGQPVVQHVLMRLRPQVSSLMISANRHLDRYRALGVPVVTDGPVPTTGCTEPSVALDAPRFDGPLAGVLAALRACQTPWLACVPCDAPWFPHDLVDRLMESAASMSNALSRPAHAAVAVRSVAGNPTIEPAFCLLHRDLTDSLAQSLASGQRKWLAWLQTCGAAHAVFEEPMTGVQGPTGTDPFGNLNTPDDWARAQHAAGQRPIHG